MGLRKKYVAYLMAPLPTTFTYSHSALLTHVCATDLSDDTCADSGPPISFVTPSTILHVMCRASPTSTFFCRKIINYAYI